MFPLQKKYLVFELWPVCHVVGSATWGVSTTAAQQPGHSLKGPGHSREQVAHFKELACVQRWELGKLGLYAGSSSSNYCSYFLHVYCLLFYPAKSEFLMPARRKNKNQQSTQSIIRHRDRAAINLADWKVPEGNTSSASWTEGWHYSCGTWCAFSTVPKGPALLKSISSVAGNWTLCKYFGWAD